MRASPEVAREQSRATPAGLIDETRVYFRFFATRADDASKLERRNAAIRHDDRDATSLHQPAACASPRRVLTHHSASTWYVRRWQA